MYPLCCSVTIIRAGNPRSGETLQTGYWEKRDQLVSWVDSCCRLQSSQATQRQQEFNQGICHLRQTRKGDFVHLWVTSLPIISSHDQREQRRSFKPLGHFLCKQQEKNASVYLLSRTFFKKKIAALSSRESATNKLRKKRKENQNEGVPQSNSFLNVSLFRACFTWEVCENRSQEKIRRPWFLLLCQLEILPNIWRVPLDVLQTAVDVGMPVNSSQGSGD